MLAPLTSPRKKNATAYYASLIYTPQRPRPSTYYSPRSPRSPQSQNLSTLMKTASEVTGQQFAESLRHELDERIKPCVSEYDRFEVHREFFADLVERYGHLGGIRRVKEGYDQLLDELNQNITEFNKKIAYIRMSTSHIDNAIIIEEGKLAQKREKYKKLSDQIDFVVDDISKEINEQTDQLFKIQKSVRKISAEIKDKAVIIAELTQDEEKAKNEYEESVKKKESLEQLLEETKQKRVDIQNELNNFMVDLYKGSDYHKEMEDKLNEQRKTLAQKREEIENIRKQLSEAKETERIGQEKLKQKNDEFDLNKDIIQKLQFRLTPKARH